VGGESVLLLVNSVRPYWRHFASAHWAVIYSYLVPPMRPQYLSPASRLWREMATTSRLAWSWRPS